MNRTLLLCALALTGCAGARTEVVASGATMPVSMSRGVRDAGGALVPEQRKAVVGRFEESRTAWSMAYSLASLTPKTDISDALNDQVTRAHGQAVVRVSIRSKPCATNFFPIFNLLPFWPGCARVLVQGDIVRIDAKGGGR